MGLTVLFESMDELISMEFVCLEIKLSFMHHLDAKKQMEKKIQNLTGLCMATGFNLLVEA